MKQDEIVSKIKTILVNDLFVEVPEGQMDLDAGLQSVYGLDSLGFVELRLACDQAFGIKITDEEFSPDNFRSIRALAAFVEGRAQATVTATG